MPGFRFSSCGSRAAAPGGLVAMLEGAPISNCRPAVHFPDQSPEVAQIAWQYAATVSGPAIEDHGVGPRHSWTGTVFRDAAPGSAEFRRRATTIIPSWGRWMVEPLPPAPPPPPMAYGQRNVHRWYGVSHIALCQRFARSRCLGATRNLWPCRRRNQVVPTCPIRFDSRSNLVETLARGQPLPRGVPACPNAFSQCCQLGLPSGDRPPLALIPRHPTVVAGMRAGASQPTIRPRHLQTRSTQRPPLPRRHVPLLCSFLFFAPRESRGISFQQQLHSPVHSLCREPLSWQVCRMQSSAKPTGSPNAASSAGRTSDSDISGTRWPFGRSKCAKSTALPPACVMCRIVGRIRFDPCCVCHAAIGHRHVDINAHKCCAACEIYVVKRFESHLYPRQTFQPMWRKSRAGQCQTPVELGMEGVRSYCLPPYLAQPGNINTLTILTVTSAPERSQQGFPCLLTRIRLPPYLQ